MSVKLADYGYGNSFPAEQWTDQERYLLEPFVTNLDGYVACLRNLPPEIIGALCSRTSRAGNYLPRVLLEEYIQPILNPKFKPDATEKDKQAAEKLSEELKLTIDFLHKHGFRNILNNQRAQNFYIKWLAQYGDDSIAQMTGTHLVLWGCSQVAMKFIEDQRLGLEPIEQSTRYVPMEKKIGNSYRYYRPYPDLERYGLLSDYLLTLNILFNTYRDLLAELKIWLKNNYPEEKDSILEKKALDTLRGLLPMATLGQVAFRGNAQSFEYLIHRSRKHPLGELRWLSREIEQELDKEIPSLLLRLKEPKATNYQRYLLEKRHASERFVKQLANRHKNDPWQTIFHSVQRVCQSEVSLIGYDSWMEDKILASTIFSETHLDLETCFNLAKNLSPTEKDNFFREIFWKREERWQKVADDLEMADFIFEITMNIGAYRDLHRHRIMTQESQLFSTYHGFDVPKELEEAGLAERFQRALGRADQLYRKLANHDPLLAQYVVPLAARVRFYQKQNARELFWETELRTIPQGHPDYRHIEQEKYRLMAEKFPRLAGFMKVDMNQYGFARRGTEETIKRKEEKLAETLAGKSD